VRVTRRTGDLPFRRPPRNSDPKREINDQYVSSSPISVSHRAEKTRNREACQAVQPEVPPLSRLTVGSASCVSPRHQDHGRFVSMNSLFDYGQRTITVYRRSGLTGGHASAGTALLATFGRQTCTAN